LRGPRGQVFLEHEHQDYIALTSEVRDVLGDNRPARGPGGCRNLSVIGAAESYVGDMNRVVTVLISEQHRCGWREHLVD
jgi:hypothetical protein